MRKTFNDIISSLQLIPIILISCLLSLPHRGLAQWDPNSEAGRQYESIKHKGIEFGMAGQWDSALWYENKLNEMELTIPGIPDRLHAITLFSLGEIYYSTGNWRKAGDLYRQCLKEFYNHHHTLDSCLVCAYSIERLGLQAYFIGADEEAINYLKKAVEMDDKLNRSTDNIQPILMMGACYIDMGQYAEADSINRTLEKILDTTAQNYYALYIKASLYNNFAIASLKTGNYDEALKYLRRSAELELKARTPDFETDYEQILLNMVEVYLFRSQTDSAISVCARADDSIAESHLLLRSLVLKEKALICQQQHQWNQALELLQQYKLIRDTSSANNRGDDYEAMKLNMAALLTELKQYDAADSLLRQEIAYLYGNGLKYSYNLQQAVAALCVNLYRTKKYNEAVDSALGLCGTTLNIMGRNFIGMTADEKLQYESNLNSFFDLLYASMYAAQRINKTQLLSAFRLELQRKGFALKSDVRVLNAVRSSSDSGLLKLYAAWINNRQVLSREYSQPNSERAFNLDSLIEANQILEKQMSEKGIAKDDFDKVSLNKNVRLKQKANAAYVDFVRFNYHSALNSSDSFFYAAFILMPGDTVPAFVHLCSENALAKLMKDKNGIWINENQLTQKLYDPHSGDASALYRLIWQPVEKYLAGINTINYSPSALLDNISFQAIYNGKNYLVQRYTMKRYLSLADELNDTTGPVPQRINIWGNINYDSYSSSTDRSVNVSQSDNYFSVVPKSMKTTATKGDHKGALPRFNADEVPELKGEFEAHGISVHTYENDSATEENFKRLAPNMSGILHISTHGFYSPLEVRGAKASLPGSSMSGITNPLFRCGLAFAGVNYYWLNGTLYQNHDDGILTGYEVSQLNLQRVQLVTLSACETGLGDISSAEGNIGLQRAFKMAGVKQLLVSLWEVPANETGELLALFYQDWINGQDMDEALKNAGQQMQKKHPQPYYWAGFVLIH